LEIEPFDEDSVLDSFYEMVGAPYEGEPKLYQTIRR